MVYRVRHLYPMNRFLLFCHNKRPSYDLDFIIEEPLIFTYLQKNFHTAAPMGTKPIFIKKTDMKIAAPGSSPEAAI